MNRAIYQYVPKLAILHLLVEAGTFRKASAQARVTQSALSQTISGLESFLGYPLIVREAGGVTPTPQCTELLAKVRPILLGLDGIAAGLGGDAVNLPQIASLDLGIHDSLAIGTMAALTRQLRTTFPQIHLNLRTGRSGELASSVRKGELCMAVITELDNLGLLPVHEIGEDRLGVYATAAAGTDDFSDRDLVKTIGLGALAPPKEGYPVYYSRFLRATKLPKPCVISGSFEALRAMAANGAVAAILPQRIANRANAEPLRELKLGEVSQVGRHRILLVSQRNCNQQESDFVADMLRQLCNVPV